MQKIYDEVKTPYKYGIVLKANPALEGGDAADSPSIFRKDGKWYMTYIVFGGRGYETFLAESDDLLRWRKLGKILPFTQNTWDANQKAGYLALQDYRWEGDYELEKFQDRYWLSYLGGASQGYEAGMLGVGIASTDDPTLPQKWDLHPRPVMLPSDADAKWHDNKVIYKSTVIRDTSRTLGHEFIMFYNAKGAAKYHNHSSDVERIATAVSNDMITWKRYGEVPALDHGSGITGDAFIAKIGSLWVMFYFGAFWRPKAFDRFACSYDLEHWTDWNGPDLIAPTESYDEKYAHKPFVIKYDGIVYHFYNAVGSQGRCIALSTSRNLRLGGGL